MLEEIFYARSYLGIAIWLLYCWIPLSKWASLSGPCIQIDFIIVIFSVGHEAAGKWNRWVCCNTDYCKAAGSYCKIEWGSCKNEIVSVGVKHDNFNTVICSWSWCSLSCDTLHLIGHQSCSCMNSNVLNLNVRHDSDNIWEVCNVWMTSNGY